MDDRNRKLSGFRSQFKDIPSCLIFDIFLRLPIKSLLSCRFVCKSWFLLFSDPLFVELHRAGQPTCILLRTGKVERRKHRLSQLGEIAGGENLEVDPVELVASINLPNCRFSFANACSGLLCLEDWLDCKFKHIVYVCNPILGEYITIPIANSETKYWAQCALGFCSGSNQFKVLQIYFPKRSIVSDFVAEIYTIGNGTRQWRSVGIAPSYPSSLLGSNTFLNGSIHWVSSSNREFNYFDFENEQFGSLPSPFHCDGEYFHLVKLGVLDGCLWASLIRHRCSDELEIWVMKEYGVSESWTKMFFVDKLFEEHNHFYYHELLCLLHDQKILIWHHKRGVVCYDGKSNKIHDTDMIKAKRASLGIRYNPSVVSLRDVAKGEQLTVPVRTRTQMG